jgi:hypothetical protein
MKLSQMNHCKINRESRRAQKMGLYQDRDITTPVIIAALILVLTISIIGAL